MKTIRCDDCEHYDFKKHSCSRCGRSLPDVCFEFDEMKRKAEAYERLSEKDVPVASVDHADPEHTRDVSHSDDPQVKSKPTRKAR